MTASKRAVRRRQCEGKIRYDNHNAAWAAATAMTYKRSEKLGAYKCDFCGGYHIGHPIGKGGNVDV